MPSRPSPPGIAILLGSAVVVIISAMVGSLWGSEPFIAACLVSSILVGLVITDLKAMPQKRPGHGPTDPSLRNDPLFRLDFRALWAWLRSRPLSFWLVSLYLLLEYVRPQQIYPSISGWPLPFWTIILCGVVYLFESHDFRGWHLGDTLMAGVAVSVILSTVTAWKPAVAEASKSVFFGWLVVYWLITSIIRTRHTFYVFLLIYLLYCVKMTQFGFRSWASAGFHFITIGVGCAPGWFENSGECGAQMAILFPVSLFLILAIGALWSQWKRLTYIVILPLGSLVTIMASSSRGAIFGLAATGLWFVAKSKKRFKVLTSAVVVASISWFVILPEQFKARFYTIGQDPSSLQRKGFWRDGLKILNQFPLFGIGYYNWLPYYRQYYDPQGLVPHNIFIEASAQQGYVGLFAFVACILGTFVINARTRKLAAALPSAGHFYTNMTHGFDGAMIGFLVAGSFVTILYYPFFWINLAMTVSLNLAAAQDVARLKGRSVSRSRPFGRAAAPRAAGAGQHT